MGDDPAEAVAELRELRRGRGLLSDDIDTRVGPRLRTACGIVDSDPPATVRRKLVLHLTERCGRLPADLKLAVLVALALHPSADHKFLHERMAWLAAHYDRDPRTARRRIDEGFRILAESLVDLHRVTEAPSTSPFAVDGWYVESMKATLRLDVDPPRLIEERRIVATADELDEVVSALSAPRFPGMAVPGLYTASPATATDTTGTHTVGTHTVGTHTIGTDRVGLAGAGLEKAGTEGAADLAGAENAGSDGPGPAAVGPDGARYGEPLPPIQASMLHGGEIVEERRPTRGHARFVVRLPRPLALGERHEFGIEYVAYSRDQLRPYYAVTPLRRYDRVQVRIRFGTAGQPARLWKLNGVHPRVVDEFVPTDEPLTVDSVGEVRLEFFNLRQGLSYGAQWLFS